MADWTTRIAEELDSNPAYAEFFVADVRERTGSEVSHQEILEALRVVKKYPFPLEEYRGRHVRWTTAKLVGAVIRYVRNPDGYHREVENREQERLQSQKKPVQHKGKLQKCKVLHEVLACIERQANESAENQEWEHVVKVCLQWLELLTNKLKPMSRLAWAYYNTDQLNEAEELCRTIRSSFRLNANDLDAVESLLGVLHFAADY